MQSSENKTVYFLGAGASHASEYELPCMNGFFRDDDFQSGDYPNLLKFIERTFPRVASNKFSLEEIVTSLELSLDTFGCFGEHPESYILEARRELSEYVKNRLYIPAKACREHKRIFSTEIAGRSSQDSIITLNYDLVVDNTIWELWLDSYQRDAPSLLRRMQKIVGKARFFDGELASIEVEFRDLGHYLKLHGSVNWVYCLNNMCSNHQLFFVSHISPGQASQDASGDLCNLCGSPLVSVIVPPTMQKAFHQFPKLGLIWSLAYRELNKAKKVVIFGVSFARSDYYLTWLFKKAMVRRDDHTRPTIVNINPDESVSEQIERITGIKPIQYCGLDEYLAQGT